MMLPFNGGDLFVINAIETIMIAMKRIIMIRSPLIQPGNYDITLNQNYLLEKLHIIDVKKAEMAIAWDNLFYYIVIGAIIMAIGLYLITVCCKSHEEREKERERNEEAIFNEFHELCRLIYEDKHVFRRPDKMVFDMYYPRMRELMQELRKKEKILFSKYRHLKPDYLFYRNLFHSMDNDKE